jgi:hypothetical protein
MLKNKPYLECFKFLFSVLKTSQQRPKGYYSNSDFMRLTSRVKHNFRGSEPTSLHMAM